MESTILNLFVDNKNQIWTTTTKGTYLLDSSLHEKKTPITYAITALCQDKDNILWGTANLRIAQYNINGETINYTTTKSIHRSIFVKDSLLYCPTRLGLDIFTKALKQHKTPPVLNDQKISNILELNDSILVIATIGNGFFLLNLISETYKHYCAPENLIAYNIYTLLKTKSKLCLGTEKGIIYIDISSLYSNKPICDYISESSGILNNKITDLLYINNSLWAFSENGYTVITDLQNEYTYKHPKYYLKAIKVNNSLIDKNANKELSHNQNNIEIIYGFIAFNNPIINTRYRLGNGLEWHYSNNRSILLHSLEPANYKFELEYSIDNLNWIPLDMFYFTINKPWWEQWYFQLSIVFIIVFIAYVYFKSRITLYKQKNQLLKVTNDHKQKLIQAEIETLERERIRIAKELHDGVGTNLTAIKLTINQLLKQHEVPTAPDVEEQFQQTIKEIKDIIYGLTPAGLERYGLFAGLKDYIEKLNKNIDSKIELNTFGLEIKKNETNLLVFRVVQELISNSLKHSSAKKISIHINSFEDLLNIVYEDDGVGFSYDSVKNGLGLNNIESRIQSVNGKLTFESGAFGVSYNIDIPINQNSKL